MMWKRAVSGIALALLAAGGGQSGGERIIAKDVTVSAPLERVWAAWTTSEGTASFFAPKSHVELRVGGPYEMYFVPDAPEGSRGSEGCHVLSYIPKEMLSFEWNAPPSIPTLRTAGAKTHVVLRFEELDEGRVRVKLAHLGFGRGEAWDKYYEYFDRAWGRVLENFEAQFPPAGETSKQPPQAKKHWVYYIRPARPGFFDGATDFENEKIGEHARYLKTLLDDGTLVLAGPSFGPPYYPDTDSDTIPFEMPTPGIVVFEAQDAEAARKIMANDPAVKAGVFKARLNEFRLVFHRE